jgi:hypothetical protein
MLFVCRKKVNGMARPRVVDKEGGLHIWRVAKNVLIKQSQATDKGWSYNFGTGRGANNSSLGEEEKLVTKYYTEPQNLMDLREIGWEGVDWIQLAVVNAIMNFRIQ